MFAGIDSKPRVDAAPTALPPLLGGGWLSSTHTGWKMLDPPQSCPLRLRERWVRLASLALIARRFLESFLSTVRRAATVPEASP